MFNWHDLQILGCKCTHARIVRQSKRIQFELEPCKFWVCAPEKRVHLWEVQLVGAKRWLGSRLFCAEYWSHKKGSAANESELKQTNKDMMNERTALVCMMQVWRSHLTAARGLNVILPQKLHRTLLNWDSRVSWEYAAAVTATMSTCGCGRLGDACRLLLLFLLACYSPPVAISERGGVSALQAS
jgi:hypothetical protein